MSVLSTWEISEHLCHRQEGSFRDVDGFSSRPGELECKERRMCTWHVRVYYTMGWKLELLSETRQVALNTWTSSYNDSYPRNKQC
jgi:hypothetical protein